ncbi:hypothetical protein SESBI_38456 [Sesbania bispinosa]|nr:hypothetical protein SESBI_38456 [Sesbania bispinosa]
MSVLRTISGGSGSAQRVVTRNWSSSVVLMERRRAAEEERGGGGKEVEDGRDKQPKV